MESQEIPQIINIHKLFKDKNPGLYKLLPGFIFRYIKHTLHQDKLNQILHKGNACNGIEFANLVLSEMGAKTTCKGIENIPQTGPVIIVANHPLGGLDAMALISYVGQIRTDLRYLVNDVLTKLPNFESLFVPVNKFGSNAKSNLAYIDEIYSTDAAILIFPSGRCSRRIKGVITDSEWQKSFVSKAQKYQHPILPVFIKGQNSSWFYNLAQFRAFLGIKANIEMFYLADEMFKQNGKTIEITIGPIIHSAILTTQKSSKAWANRIKNYVYGLENKNDTIFD